MQWDAEAEQAVRRAPALLRGFVRKKVEAFARQGGAQRVTAEIVDAAHRGLRPDKGRGEAGLLDPALVERLERELAASEAERRKTRSYLVRVCAGAVGCPRSLVPVAEVGDALVTEIESSGFPSFLIEGRAGRPILSHHRFQAVVAGCPNACSQPQIADFGVVGGTELAISPEECSGCEQCVAACRESSITAREGGPRIVQEACLGCGDCARACPTGALRAARGVYRVIAGGKLGRHPRLAVQVLGGARLGEVRAELARALELLMREGKPGERLVSRHVSPDPRGAREGA